MHVSHLKPVPLLPATPVEPVATRKKHDDDTDRVSRREDEAKEERRRRQAWLEASLEKLDEEGPANEGDETYRATSAPSSQAEQSPESPKFQTSAPEPAASPLDDLLAGIKAEPSTEHPEIVVEPKPSLDELLGHILEKPDEN